MITVPHIDSYQFGKIIIDSSVYTKDVILLPTRIISGWWRKEGHLLQVIDLHDVLSAEPDVLVIGQGAYGRMHIKAEVEDALRKAGIEMIGLTTGKACQEYNHRSSFEKVVAALHLTC